MRIAVLEAVCAGLCGDDPSPSLQAEGRAMWQALIEDLLAVNDIAVETVVDPRCASPLASATRLHVRQATHPDEAINCWQSCLAETDAAWIIAPECDGLLDRLVAAVPAGHTRFNSTPAAIRLCTDKLELAGHLQQHGIATIPTVAENWQAAPLFAESPFVIKPRDGAGSDLVRRVHDVAEWNQVQQEFAARPPTAAIRQPYLAGQTLSIAGWFHTRDVQWFPIAEQILGQNFAYCGGLMPADIPDHDATTIRQLVTAAAATIPGLHGYVGFDILLPTAAISQPVIVEINPRLTTSSIGYRRLCSEPWLKLLLADPERPLPWKTGMEIHFTSAGLWREWTR